MLFKVPVAPQDQLGMLSLHVEGLIKSFIPPEVTSTGAEQLGGGALCTSTGPALHSLGPGHDTCVYPRPFFLTCDLLSRAFWSIFTLNAFG